MYTPPFTVSAEAIADSTAAADCGAFIDFMLGEILNTLKEHKGEKLEQVDNKVTNKSNEMDLELLDKDGALTIAQLARLMNMSNSGIKKILALLKREGCIEREGSNKNGCWVVEK